MKKTLLTLGSILGVSASAFAQGSVTIETQSTSPGVAVGQWNPNLTSGTGTAVGNWYTGSLALQIYYAPGSDSNAASEIAAINSPEAINAGLNFGYFYADTDFTLETISSASSGTLSPSGTTVTVNCNSGSFDTTVDLPNVPSDSNAYWVVFGTATIGGKTLPGLVGLANMSTGAAGSPEDDASAWNAAGINLDLTYLDVAPIPEPTTFALAGLGGLSMLTLRRRKTSLRR